MSVPILSESPAVYRVARGRPGADDLMSRDVGSGGRYFITTGEAATLTGGAAAVTQSWRHLLNPQSPGFAVFVLGVALLLIHAHASASFSVSK